MKHLLKIVNHPFKMRVKFNKKNLILKKASFCIYFNKCYANHPIHTNLFTSEYQHLSPGSPLQLSNGAPHLNFQQAVNLRRPFQ